LAGEGGDAVADKDGAMAAGLPRKALQQRVGIKAAAAMVDQPCDDGIGAKAQQRAERAHPDLVGILDRIGEPAHLGAEGVEFRQHFLRGDEQCRLGRREGDVCEPFGRGIKEGAAPRGQPPHQRIAEAEVIEGRTSAGTVIADGVFRLEYDNLSMLGEAGGNGESRNAAADDDEVGCLGHWLTIPPNSSC
jgi:hypothetical protein